MALVWPLAGTPVPISDSVANAREIPKKKGPRFRAFLPESIRPTSWNFSSHPRERNARLQDGLGPVFQGLLDLVQELVGSRAVHHAVVVAERHLAHRADGDGVVDDHRPLLDSTEAENPDVWLTDDLQSKQATKDNRVGNREGALLHFLGLQLFRARALP